MKRLLVIIGIFMMTACSGSDMTETEEAEAVYRKITAAEAKEMMDNGEGRIIDVRELSEYQAGHVEGAELIPLGDIKAGEPAALADRGEVLLLYCRSGNRSAQAAKVLVGYGYTQVYDFGGIIDWPYDVVK